MLILSRKMNERIIIDNKITITVLDIGGGRVRLGISAPSDVGIAREELLADGSDTVPHKGNRLVNAFTNCV